MKAELKKQHNVKIKVRAKCEEVGITTAYQLQVAVGLAPSVAQNLFNEKFTEISLPTLERLCNALKCGLNDLLEVEIDENFPQRVVEEAKERKERKAEKESEKTDSENVAEQLAEQLNEQPNSAAMVIEPEEPEADESFCSWSDPVGMDCTSCEHSTM